MRGHIIVVVLLIISTQCLASKKNSSNKKNGKDINLTVGKPHKDPNISKEKGEKQAKEEPTTDASTEDYAPGEVDGDPSKINDVKDKYESGTPPKFPEHPRTSDVTAHDSEITGCRDHPNAVKVCKKCDNACFGPEHETYTYSYCRKSCSMCEKKTSTFHTYWRLRAGSPFEPTWMLKDIEFYHLTSSNKSLIDDPKRSYAKSSYKGYSPEYAFDGNNETSWYPDGWGKHDGMDDWIAFEFPVAVRIHGVRVLNDDKHPTAAPTKIFVEGSDQKYEGFETKWIIHNPTNTVDKHDTLHECPVLWKKRYDDNDSAWCYRLMAQEKNWEEARQGCDEEGGELASVLSEEEEKFLSKDLKVCGFQWIGLNKQNNAYYWEDGSNSTYRNWKEDLMYSEIQKDKLDCVAIDQDGKWYLFDCDSKFYFICKKKLEAKEPARPDLVPKPWPYPPETPPVIFFYPNMTVPVINTKNLPPGVFPDANGNVVINEEDEDTNSLDSIFYTQTVKHLLEKGLKPTDEMKPDENEDPNHYTKQLNKIALQVNDAGTKNESGVKPSVNLETNRLPQTQGKEVPVHAENEPTKPDASIDTDSQVGVGAPTVDGKPAATSNNNNVEQEQKPAQQQNPSTQPVSGPPANNNTTPSDVPSQPSGGNSQADASAQSPNPVQPPKSESPTSQKPGKPEQEGNANVKPPQQQEGTEQNPPASVGEAGEESDDDNDDDDSDENDDNDDSGDDSESEGKNLPESPNQIRNKESDVDKIDKATDKPATVGGQSNTNLVKAKVKNTMARLKDGKKKSGLNKTQKKKSAFNRSNVTSDEGENNSESKELNDIINSMNEDLI